MIFLKVRKSGCDVPALESMALFEEAAVAAAPTTRSSATAAAIIATFAALA